MTHDPINASPPGVGAPSGGLDERRGANHLPELYTKPSAITIIPFVTDSLVEHEYWRARAADCLYRAWHYYKTGNPSATTKALEDFFSANSKGLATHQEGK